MEPWVVIYLSKLRPYVDGAKGLDVTKAKPEEANISGPKIGNLKSTNETFADLRSVRRNVLSPSG
jgi:hypothetical protein